MGPAIGMISLIKHDSRVWENSEVVIKFTKIFECTKQFTNGTLKQIPERMKLKHEWYSGNSRYDTSPLS